MKVTHVKHRLFTVYIGRPSIYGNPFVVGKDGTRSECIKKFEKFARSNDGILNAIKKLPKDAVLGCHCSPKKCHGDVIVKLWKEMNP